MIRLGLVATWSGRHLNSNNCAQLCQAFWHACSRHLTFQRYFRRIWEALSKAASFMNHRKICCYCQIGEEGGEES